MTKVSDYRYLIATCSNWIPVIGHPLDCVPIMWQMGVHSTNYDWEFCYRCDQASKWW